MKTGRIVTAGCAALLVLGVGACGGDDDSADETPATTSAATATPTATATATATATPTETAEETSESSGSGGLTPAGTKLALGKTATVKYTPPGVAFNKKGPKYKMEFTVLSIEKGSIAKDFTNVDLDADQKKQTPYYVRIREKNLGPGTIKSDQEPTFAFDAIDDRGQPQGDLTILGTFDKCESTSAPKPFSKGKGFETCRIYMVGGGGRIKEVRFSGSGADVYTDKPIVWK